MRERKVKLNSVLPVEWHIERVRHMLAGAFNITPLTVGEEAFKGYARKALMERMIER
jgi:hypothetical protein